MAVLGPGPLIEKLYVYLDNICQIRIIRNVKCMMQYASIDIQTNDRASERASSLRHRLNFREM